MHTAHKCSAKKLHVQENSFCSVRITLILKFMHLVGLQKQIKFFTMLLLSRFGSDSVWHLHFRLKKVNFIGLAI
jgi:hypothetical protein